MKTKKHKFLILFLLFLISFANAQNSYAKKYNNLSAELSSRYGIPQSVILSVGLMESGAGKSKNSKELNNHFGIEGKNTVSKSRYKSFAKVEDSFEAFCTIISHKKFYSRLKGTKDTSAWISHIAASGYSEKPLIWTQRVSNIIRKLGH